MPDDDLADDNQPQGKRAASGREAWVRPTLCRLKTEAADYNPAGFGDDSMYGS